MDRISIVLDPKQVSTLIGLLGHVAEKRYPSPEIRAEAAVAVKDLEERSLPPDVTEEEYKRYTDFAASEMRGGEIEMDRPPPISISDAGGAYVGCWYYVDGVDAGVLVCSPHDVEDLTRCENCGVPLADSPNADGALWHVDSDGREAAPCIPSNNS